MAVIRATHDSLPLSLPPGDDGFANITASRLSVRFNLLPESLHLDEEVLDTQTGLVTHTIGQQHSNTSNDRQWLLKPGRYRVYGVMNLFCTTSTVDSNPSASRTPLLSHVKVEPNTEVITISSDDSDCSSPDSNYVSPSCTVPRPTEVFKTESEDTSIQSFNSSISIVDSIKQLRHARGSRNVLKKIDFSSISVVRVRTLPPEFNNDIIFELPPVQVSGMSSQAKLMTGMDKRYDGHAWTRTITSHIKNDAGLTFRMSSCIGHIQCNNSSCAYLSRIHRTAPTNNTEWKGSTTTPFTVGSPPPSCFHYGL